MTLDAHRILGSVVLVIAVALVVTGCSRGPSASGPAIEGVEDAQEVSVFRLGPGTCLIGPEPGAETEVDASLEVVDAVPCSEPHRQEVFHRATFEDADTYPGVEALNGFAEATCIDHFADYVGVDYLDSSRFVTFLLPSLKGWTDGKDHDVVCLLSTTGEMIAGSDRGAGS